MPKPIPFGHHIQKLKSYYFRHRRMPTIEEAKNLFGYASKGATFKFIGRLVERGIVRKDKGKLVPTPFIEGGVRLLGSIEAGFPSPAEEELIDIQSLDQFLIKKPQATYLVKVRGDSMIEAGILPDDLVLVERGKDPRSGDIVIAQVDGEWTMKYYIKNGKDIILKAANKKYPPIKPKHELVIGAVVISVVRKYGR